MLIMRKRENSTQEERETQGVTEYGTDTGRGMENDTEKKQR
jgi:hypothetical protein